MRHERYFSSAAEDTSEASTTVHRLGRIRETEGDAVKASSEKAGNTICVTVVVFWKACVG